MLTGYSVVYRMTQTEFNAGAGLAVVGGFIEIVDTNGTPTGPVYLTGVSGSAPQLLGGASGRTRIATQHIAQWSAVYDTDGIHCSPADNTSITTCGTLVGIAGNTVDTGGIVQVITDGDIVGYAGLGVGPAFLSTSGSLTSTPPTSGVSLKLGYVPVSNILVVNVQQPIVIS